jgi:hypothetical protein
MGKRGPYDVIVFGTSVANMGWVEVMRQDLGVRACNTWPLLNQFAYKSAGTVILDNYDKINDHRRAILVYGDFFEWYNLGLSALEDNQISASSVSYNKEIVTPLVKVVRRAIHWLRVRISPQVIVCNINGDDELFFASDLRSLSEKKEFSPENYADLVKKLIHFKDRAEKIDCRFVIVAFPSKAQQYEWLLRETGNIQGVSPRASSRTLRKAAAECGIPFLDLEEKLTPIAKEVYAKERRLLWWRDDTHMNGLGVKYVAAIVKEFIDTLDKQN